MRTQPKGPVLVSVGDLARIFELSIRRVQQIVPFGATRPAHGKYDVGLCMLWFIRHQNRRLENLTNRQSTGILHERTRLFRAKADLKELALQDRKSRLIPVVEVKKAFEELASATRNAMEFALMRVTAELRDIEGHETIEAPLRKHMAGALRHLDKSPY